MICPGHQLLWPGLFAAAKVGKILAILIFADFCCTECSYSVRGHFFHKCQILDFA